MAKSILSFMATTIAVTCSAALPTIGITIKPINVLDNPEDSTTLSMAPTNKSAQSDTRIVATTKTTNELTTDKCSTSGLAVLSSGGSDVVMIPSSASWACSSKSAL